MTITAKQLEQRRKCVGGSDVYDVCAGNARRVYDEKTTDLVPWEGNDATWTGSMLEASLLDVAEEWFGKLRRNQRRVLHGTPLAANTDALLNNNDVIECKTSGIVSSFTPTDQWGSEGTDEIPIPYIFQVHASMLCAGSETAHVIALIGGRGICRYTVTFNEELGSHIRNRVQEFWDRHVLTGCPPDGEWAADCVPTLDVIKRIRREPGSLATLDPKLVENYERIATVQKWVSEQEKAAKLLVLDALGTAEASQVLPDGRQVTYLTQGRTSLRGADLKRDHPEIHEQYSKRSEHPVMRIAKARKGLEHDDGNPSNLPRLAAEDGGRDVAPGSGDPQKRLSPQEPAIT